MHQEEPCIITNRKEMDTARYSLMCIYRMFELDRKNELDTNRQLILDAKINDIRKTLDHMQLYEKEVMRWSAANPWLAAQTGYRPDEYDAILESLAKENELRRKAPHLYGSRAESALRRGEYVRRFRNI